MNKRSSKIHLLLALLVSFGSAVWTSHANARISRPLLDVWGLKGIDTVVVFTLFAANSVRQLSHDYAGVHVDKIAIEVVQNVFASANSHLQVKDNWLSVKPYREVPIDKILKPNVLQLGFDISIREESYGGKTVKVGAVSLTLVRTGADRITTKDPEEASYPFIVSDNPNEFSAQIAEGVRYLTSFLPSYLVCANKYGHRSEQCPDCDMSACQVDKPYGEK